MDCMPPDEAERLAALRRLQLLDSAPAESFDTVTRLASTALRLPIVLVSLVDAERQWFKSRVGLEVAETPRQISFCAHAVYERRPFIITNAARDPRFLNNPLVTGPPHIRAYLGIPLYTRDRYPVGTLCGIDDQPREFGEREIAMMSDFAKIIEVFLHAKELSARTDSVLQYAMERERLFRETFEQAAVGIVHVSLTGAVLRINQRACDMLGYSQAELRNLTFMDITHPEDVLVNIREFRRTLAGEIDRYRLEQRFERKQGDYLWATLSVALKRTAAGQPDYAIVVIDDLSERKQAQAALALAGDTDPLTGLPNRRIFSERSEAAAVAFRADGVGYGLILMDLDDFKLINNEYGHDVGDDVLRAVGSLLLTEMQGREDLAARLGGAEFALLCHGALHEETLRKLAERIRSAINALVFDAAKGPLRVTASFGVALSRPEDTDWKTLYGRADAALYEAKAYGKDRVAFGQTHAREATLRLRALPAAPLAPD
jgi:diguanylate cyclase (GGDEF)-like protein/PAS domain S-box-containing protein